MSCFPFLTVEVDVLGLNEDNSLMTYTFQKDGVAKIEGAAEIAETALTGEKGKGYWVPMVSNTKHEPEERETAAKIMPSSPLGIILEEVVQSIETVDMKLKEFFEIHGTDLQTSREIRSNSRRRK